MIFKSRKYVFVSQVLVICVLANGCSKTPSQKEATFLQKGKALADQQDYQRAILEYKNAAQVMPKDAEPYYRTALIYTAMQDNETAFAYLKQAEKLNPKHAGVQIAIAKLELRNRSTLPDAEKRMEEVSKWEGQPDAANALAVAKTLLGKTDSAIQTLQEALVKNPDNVKSARSLSSLEMMQKDPAAAEAVLVKLVKASPRSVDAGLALAEFYFRMRKFKEAESEVRRTIQLDPTNSRPLLLLAAIQTAEDQKDQAEKTYRQISDLPDKTPEKTLKLVHARFLLQQGQKEPAIKELEQLAKQMPGDRTIRGMLVSAELSAGKTKEAKEVLDKALKENPKDTDALLQRSRFSLNDGKLEETAGDLRSVLRANPKSAEAHYALAKVSALQGSALVERQELGETLRLNPAALEARIELSRLMLTKTPKASLDLLDEAPKAQTRLYNYIVARNWALLALKNNVELQKSLAAGLTISRGPELLYQSAELKMSEKDYAGARSLVEEALNKNQENMPALDLLAQTYALQGHVDKAVETMETRLKSKPDSPYLLSMLGTWQSRAHRPELARESFVRATTANSNYLPARLALAHLDVSLGKVDEARRSLEFVLSREPKNVLALLGLGVIEERTTNPLAARQHFQAALDVDPGNLDALRNLANNLATDKPDEALKYAESAVELAPDDAGSQDTLGWVYYRKNLYPNALTCFKNAVASRPTAMRRYHLALAYAKVGERQLANQNMTAARQLDPTLKVTEALAR